MTTQYANCKTNVQWPLVSPHLCCSVTVWPLIHLLVSLKAHSDISFTHCFVFFGRKTTPSPICTCIFFCWFFKHLHSLHFLMFCYLYLALLLHWCLFNLFICVFTFIFSCCCCYFHYPMATAFNLLLYWVICFFMFY